jgi:glutamate racemase
MKNNNQKYIGVFDSGFGGIDVLRGIVASMPQYNFIYLGDTARTPYGTRSKEVVYEFTRQAVEFLFENNCELIILACNTASSMALRKIQQEYLPKYYPEKRVLGVLIPAAEEAVETTKNKRVGVIGTSGTVASGSFMREINKFNPKIQVFEQACPLLVPIVEEGEQDSEITEIMLTKYLKPLMDDDIDTLVLGCTHYGILKEQIQKIIGPNVTVLSESKVIPEKLADYLTRHPEIGEKIGEGGIAKFFSTDLTDKFTTLGSKFFGREIEAEKVSLE